MSKIHYFAECRTVESVKAKFRELAKSHHPDLGGDEETMKAINAAYHAKLEDLDGQKSTGKDGNEHTYHYNAEREEAIAAKIAEVLPHLKGTAELWLIGLWIWVFETEKGDGNAEALKAAGFRWARHRSAWTWKPYTGGGRRSSQSIEGIAAQYGAKKFAHREGMKRSNKAAAFRLTA